MVGDGTVWQKTETSTGIIEGYHLPQACKDEKDPNNFLAGCSSRVRCSNDVWRYGDKGRGLCAFARTASLITSDLLNFHLKLRFRVTPSLEKKDNKINFNLPILHTVKCGGSNLKH